MLANENGDIGFWGSESQRVAVAKAQSDNNSTSMLPNKGVLLKRIETDSYTYMLVEAQGKQVWLAAPVNTIEINSKIRFSDGVHMSNFHSKSLNKTFDAILFVGIVAAAN